MYHAQARDMYRDNQILTAPQNKLIVMLYDGAMKNIRLAKLSVEDEKISDVNSYLLKAQDIVMELMTTLDFELGGEVAKSLYKMYDYMYSRLITANINKDVDAMDEVNGLMKELRDAWAQI